MQTSLRSLAIALLMAAIIAGCASRQPAREAAPPPTQASTGAYVAPQSAPVRSPTYPTLGGSVFGTGYIPLVQGR